MEVALNISHLVQAAIGALGYIVYMNMRTETSRIERHCNDKIKRVERQGEAQSEKNSDRIARIEDSTMRIPAQIEKLASQMAEQLNRLELKITREHVTKDELVVFRDARMARLEELVERMASRDGNGGNFAGNAKTRA